jgi:pentatricopeptide repeat protein
MGELTVSAYILLESLCKVGMVKMAESLLNEPTTLFHSALCCAIGIRAGMTIPEGAKFETTTSDSDFGIRDITGKEDESSD